MLCSTPVTVTTSGIVALKPSENHVSTCTKDLIISTTMDEEIMVKLAIVTAGYNTEIHIYCDVGALESFRYSSTLQNIQILNVNSLCNKTSTKPYKD